MTNKQKRTTRIRHKAQAVTSRTHRLNIHRSTKNIYAQVINRKDASIAASATSLKLKGKKADQAAKVGENLAKAVLAKKITQVYLDRGPYKYHGRVKALSDAARKAGLKF